MADKVSAKIEHLVAQSESLLLFITPEPNYLFVRLLLRVQTYTQPHTQHMHVCLFGHVLDIDNSVLFTLSHFCVRSAITILDAASSSLCWCTIPIEKVVGSIK